MATRKRGQRERIARGGIAARLIREWLVLELAGHVGLILLRQLCGTAWSWRTGGPFAYWDVSRAMLHGDAFWVIAAVCASAIRLRLLAEWGGWLGQHRCFGRWAWPPWLAPGCLLGWAVLIRDDAGAAYILALPAGGLFEGYHVLFFGYIFARIAEATAQLAVALRILRRHRPAARLDGPWPALPLGVGLIACAAILCALAYTLIFRQGGSIQAEWGWFARG